MNPLVFSLLRMMEFIHFMQIHPYMVNIMAISIFMSMALIKFIIIFETMVLVKTNLNTSTQMLSLNCKKAILFTSECRELFIMRVHIVMKRIFKVILLTFYDMISFLSNKIKQFICRNCFNMSSSRKESVI